MGDSGGESNRVTNGTSAAGAMNLTRTNSNTASARVHSASRKRSAANLPATKSLVSATVESSMSMRPDERSELTRSIPRNAATNGNSGAVHMLQMAGSDSDVPSALRRARANMAAATAQKKAITNAVDLRRRIWSRGAC